MNRCALPSVRWLYEQCNLSPAALKTASWLVTKARVHMIAQDNYELADAELLLKLLCVHKRRT